MYIAHVLLFPILIGGLLGAHLLLVMLKHHTQFKRRRSQTEHAIVGVPTWPGQAPRSVGLALATAGVLFLLGGLVEINPIWLWGPFHTYSSTNGAQPDWYLGWLIGGLRLVPSFDWVIGSYTVVPNPFWGGAAFPLVVFGFLYFWPWLERKVTGDRAFHNLLERPRDAPVRTGDRRRDDHLGRARVPRGRLRPRRRPLRDQLRRADLGLPGARLGRCRCCSASIAWWICKELQGASRC